MAFALVVFLAVMAVFQFTLWIGYIIQTLRGDKDSSPAEVTVHEIDNKESRINIYHENGDVETLKFYHAGDIMFNNMLLVRATIRTTGHLEIWDMKMNDNSLFKMTPPGEWQDKVRYSLELAERMSHGAVSNESIKYIDDMVKDMDIYNQYVKENKLKPIVSGNNVRFEWVG